MSTDNKQNLRANKQHLNLIWVIYSSDLNHGLGTFLHPWGADAALKCLIVKSGRVWN